MTVTELFALCPDSYCQAVLLFGALPFCCHRLHLLHPAVYSWFARPLLFILGICETQILLEYALNVDLTFAITYCLFSWHPLQLKQENSCISHCCIGWCLRVSQCLTQCPQASLYGSRMLYSAVVFMLTTAATLCFVCPSSITCVNSMDMSYIPIAKTRGFTTYWIKIAS